MLLVHLAIFIKSIKIEKVTFYVKNNFKKLIYLVFLNIVACNAFNALHAMDEEVSDKTAEKLLTVASEYLDNKSIGEEFQKNDIAEDKEGDYPLVTGLMSKSTENDGLRGDRIVVKGTLILEPPILADAKESGQLSSTTHLPKESQDIHPKVKEEQRNSRRICSDTEDIDQQLTQEPYGYLLRNIEEIKTFINFVKIWIHTGTAIKCFESKSLEVVEKAMSIMSEEMILLEGRKSNENLVMYHEIAKFNSYIIKQMKRFREKNEEIFNKLRRESTGKNIDDSQIFSIPQKVDSIMEKHHLLIQKTKIYIDNIFDLNFSKLKTIKDRLESDDTCVISVALNGTSPYVILGIKNEERGINIRVFMERGVFSYPAEKEKSLISYINPLSYLPKKDSRYKLGSLAFSTDPILEEDRIRPWIVNSSYVVFALDKLIADCREPKKYLDDLEGYSEEYTNDLYYFSQLLRDFFQVRPTDSISELRSKSSSNEEIKKYFFVKARYLPGYKPGSIF